MKIYYDNIIFSLQKAGGISVYFYELFERINKKKCIFLKTGKEDNIFYKKLKIQERELLLKSKLPLKLSRYLNIKIKSKERFIFHSSYYRFCKSNKAINITTVHDFTYEKYGKGLKKWIHFFQKKKAIMNSKGIICVSKNTKKDLLEYIPKAKEKDIVVIYNGVSDYFFPIKTNKNDLYERLLKEEYIVYVGDRSKYKNFDLSVKLLGKLKKYKLIVIGGKKLSKKEEIKIKNSLGNNYEQLIGISTEELNIVYNCAFCLLYPSSYEGFGIPVIEAMKSGCPVIASDISSIPEIVGDAGILISNLKLDDFIDGIKKLENLNFRKELIKKGFVQSEKFSWGKMYEETEKFYLKKFKENYDYNLEQSNVNEGRSL